MFVAVLTGVLALAIGFGAGILTAQPRHPDDTSPEAGFARDMSTHHGQAVSMAIEEYHATKNPALETISVDMALTQQAQIGMMQSWLKSWGLETNSSARPMAWMNAPVPEGELMPGMPDETARTELREATGREKDILFSQLMIKHHLGGIHMVDGILSRTDNAQVREVAESMKNAQQYEIGELTKQLAAMGAKP